jgi:precorrin-6B methylase 2
MSTIIGLGKAGCNIAKELSVYPQYNIFCIDSEKQDFNKFKLIKKQKTVEDYENNFPSVQKFLSKSSAPYTVIIGGSGKISGACLRLLEQLKSRDISILYIKPEIDDL